MSIKKLLCIALALCLLPAASLANDYKCTELYEGTLDSDKIIFKRGDRITHEDEVSLKLYFQDADGNNVGAGTGDIAGFIVNGKRCAEWKVTGLSAAMIQIGSSYSGSLAFILTPAYLAADSEGCCIISGDSYRSYRDGVKKPETMVKLSGNVREISDKCAYVAVADGAIVACKTVDIESIAVGDRVSVKGKTADPEEYQGTGIPAVTADSVEKVLYAPMEEGDSGETVLEIKKRLQELGYYAANVELTAEYNETCAARVKQFQEKNGLTADGKAAVETLTALYSDAARSK